MNVPLSCPDITELEVEYVTRVLRSGQLSLGPRVTADGDTDFGLSVQRELTTNTSVEAAYLGSRINQVGIPDSNLNQLTVDQHEGRIITGHHSHKQKGDA